MDKDFIIGEIRRTAALNGGKPLGRLRLESEAGIKEYHWHKFWARYNDALQDSGFAPNSMTIAHAEGELFVKLAALARRLGRLPTQSDMGLASRDGSGLPTPKTIRTRFGNKSGMVKALAGYCERMTGHDDVLQMCAVGAVAQPAGDTKQAKPDSTNDGFVYLLKSGKHYKIGKTIHVGQRERALVIQLPQPANAVHSIRTDDPNGIEGYWHRRFAEKRKNGEWFELSQQDVAAFRRRKFM